MKNRNETIVNFIPLAKKIAKQNVKNRPNDYDEYLSLAYLSLVESADQYREGSGISFATFLIYRINFKIKDFKRSQYKNGKKFVSLYNGTYGEF